MFVMIQPRIMVLGLALFSLSWLLSDHYRPWDSFQSEALSLLAMGCLVAGLLVARNSLLVPRIIGGLVWVGLLPWLQYATGISLFAGDALLASLYLSGLLLAILFGFAIASVESKQAIDYLIGLAHAFCIAALVSAAIGLVQWLQLTEPLGIYVVQTGRGARAMGNLGQPNQLATLLLIGIAALVYLYERSRIGKFTFILAVAFITVVLVLTQSRAGMISVLVVGSFLVWKQKTIPLRVSRNDVLGWVIGFVLGALCLPFLSEILMIGGARHLAATESVSERWLIWKQVIYAIAQAPWVGYGWNQTPTASAVGALAFPGALPYTNAHSIMLDLMAWCGIPIGLLIIGVTAYWLLSRLGSLNRVGAVFAMAGLLPIAVHSCLEFPFAYAYFLIAAGFMVGIIEAGHASVKTIQLGVTGLWGFLAVWMMIGCYMTYEYFLIEEDFRIVRFESSNLGATPSSYEAPNIWMLSHMAAMLKAVRQPPEPNMSKVDIENLHKASERFIFGSVRCRYAMALGLNGDSAGIKHQLAIIRGMYGATYDAACQGELLRLQKEKYPHLSAVIEH
jgi:O-antigen ligase